jgi:hypothetical protein
LLLFGFIQVKIPYSTDLRFLGRPGPFLTTVSGGCEDAAGFWLSVCCVLGGGKEIGVLALDDSEAFFFLGTLKVSADSLFASDVGETIIFEGSASSASAGDFLLFVATGLLVVVVVVVVVVCSEGTLMEADAVRSIEGSVVVTSVGLVRVEAESLLLLGSLVEATRALGVAKNVETMEVVEVG